MTQVRLILQTEVVEFFFPIRHQALYGLSAHQKDFHPALPVDALKIFGFDLSVSVQEHP